MEGMRKGRCKDGAGKKERVEITIVGEGGREIVTTNTITTCTDTTAIATAKTPPPSPPPVPVLTLLTQFSVVTDPVN